MGPEAADLIIRTVQRSDPWYQFAGMGVAVDRTVLGSTEDVRLHDQQFVRVPGVAAGPHTVTVRYLLRGKGSGVYSYLSGYKFKLVSWFTFTLPPGQTTCISVLLYFDSDPKLSLADRLRVDFREERAALTW